ncbi:MAG: HlyD family efflux transporter periplasmic adaptor subunit [Xanthobacteraceae bacterium]|nr:MAG: HlyD family efflux transporter periplasmic adaptor subunit [Xanthobacteraceae bacterium]
MRLHYTCALMAMLVLAVPSQRLSAHEGHDHGTATPTVVLPAQPRAEAASKAFELVTIAKAGELTIYLDRFATNETVPDAAIALETPQGSVDAKRAGDGTYRLAAPWAATPGRYDLIATVKKDGVSDILAFTIEIPPAQAPTAASPGYTSTAMALGNRDRIAASNPGAMVAAIGAFVVGGIGGMFIARRRRAVQVMVAVTLTLTLVQAAFAHEGEDHGNPALAQPAGTRDTAQLLADGSVFVPKGTQRILAIRTIVSEPSAYRRTVELPGRIIPDPNASGFVQAAVGGRLSSPEGGFPRLGTPVKKGDVLAYVTPPLQAIDVSTMRQQQGDLDQQISIVERRLARYETLAPSGAVARSQLEEARLELQGLKGRRASLDKVRREPEALVAPVDGIIADGTPVAGQIAQTNAVVFHIIDPARLWIEALSYESLPALQRATARAGDKELGLAFRGAGFADRNQSIPIHFALEGDVSGIRVGQFVTVFAETPEEQRGLAVPRTSIVRTASGQDSVYEHVGAERFESRPVRIEPLDGQRVLISQGLSPGKRIVVQGAELIDHVR